MLVCALRGMGLYLKWYQCVECTVQRVRYVNRNSVRGPQAWTTGHQAEKDPVGPQPDLQTRNTVAAQYSNRLGTTVGPYFRGCLIDRSHANC